MSAVRLFEPADAPAVRAVVTAAFGRPDEATLVDRLRADGDALVELVATAESTVVGHILFSRLGLHAGDGTIARAAALAPVSVAPGHQRHGVGAALIEIGLVACRAVPVDAVIVLGHPTYYPRFGFSAEAARPLKAPFSGAAFMALELTPGALAEPATVRYAAAFGLG